MTSLFVHLICYFALTLVLVMLYLFGETWFSRLRIESSGTPEAIPERLVSLIMAARGASEAIWVAYTAFFLYVVFVDSMQVPYARSMLLATCGLSAGLRYLIGQFLHTVFPMQYMFFPSPQPETEEKQ